MRRIVDLNDFVPMKNLKKKQYICAWYLKLPWKFKKKISNLFKKKKNLFFKHVLHISFVSDNEKKDLFLHAKWKLEDKIWTKII